MQNEDIARLIVNAYNMGKEDGHNEGYDKGYDEGYEEAYDRAFRAGVEDGISQAAEAKEQEIDEQLEGLEEADELGCKCPQCVSPAEYDAGYADGFGSTLPVPDDESYPYRTGYLDGQADSKKGTDWPV